MPVELVRHACQCGCRRSRVSIVAKDGRAVSFQIPSLGGKVNPEALAKMQAGLSIGRELVSLWERFKQAVG